MAPCLITCRPRRLQAGEGETEMVDYSRVINVPGSRHGRSVEQTLT